MEQGIKEVNDKLPLRDEIAVEIMKKFIEAQVKYRRMTIGNRIKFWFGCNVWKADFDLNMPQIAQKSYDCADMMIEVKNK